LSNPPSLVSVVSRKTHTNVDDFDIRLPLSGTRGIECRSGNQYKLIFKFAAPVTSCGTASRGVASAGPTSTQCTVTLSSLTNAQYYQVNLNGVVSAGGPAANVTGPEWGLLIGDVTANGTVTTGDVTAVQGQVGGTANQSSFRYDVNANGLITTGDVTTAQSQVGSHLP
jgi:hypothetical protein